MEDFGEGVKNPQKHILQEKKKKIKQQMTPVKEKGINVTADIISLLFHMTTLCVG